MRNLTDTMTRLAANRARFAQPAGRPSPSRLVEMTGIGDNPGQLGGYSYVPPGLPAGAALVVVLHGCTQTAVGYDHGSGWSRLAERHGFALLFPEQRRTNNANLCFNWFVPEHVRRGSGEAASIAAMIEAVTTEHGLDRGQVFVTGLSAGGAMASTMLATYPDVFAGGAIIAGLPYGVASTVPEAFDRMRGHGGPNDAELARLVRDASPHRGPWPTISVWHGSGDQTVDAGNARAIVAQWRGVHGLSAKPSHSETVDGFPRRVWRDGRGRAVIEDYTITGMGHGTPLDTRGEEGGVAGAYMLDVGIASSSRIARFWGIAQADAARPTAPRAVEARQATPIRPPVRSGITKVIDDALRSAGLLR